MKKILLIFLLSFTCFESYSQLAISKYLGKNSKSYKMGLGLFENYEYPLNDDGNQSFSPLLVFSKRKHAAVVSSCQTGVTGEWFVA